MILFAKAGQPSGDFLKNKKSVLIQGQTLVCGTTLFDASLRPLCRVPSHSSPVTPASRLSYLICPGLPGLGLIVHLALRGPFAEAAFIRITPSRTLWATASQFDFPVIGFLLKLYL